MTIETRIPSILQSGTLLDRLCERVGDVVLLHRQTLALTSLILIAASSYSQVLGEIQIGESCSYFGEDLPMKVATFSSDKNAENSIQRIVEATGLPQNFSVKAASVPNAAAVIKDQDRLILYSQSFMIDTKEETGSEWGPVSIMAHEVGHHLSGHTLVSGGSRRQFELQADYFSGFVLQKMGATLEEARIAMSILGSENGSATHPPKRDRLAAITNGWLKSCEGDASCNGTDDGPDSCEFAKDGECDEPDLCRAGTDTTDCKPQRGPDSCEYAKDGECDEPDLCGIGTDTTDCRLTQQTITQQTTSICQTPAFWCRMFFPGPVGVSCYCNSYWGPVSGFTVPE